MITGMSEITAQLTVAEERFQNGKDTLDLSSYWLRRAGGLDFEPLWSIKAFQDHQLLEFQLPRDVLPRLEEQVNAIIHDWQKLSASSVIEFTSLTFCGRLTEGVLLRGWYDARKEGLRWLLVLQKDGKELQFEIAATQALCRAFQRLHAALEIHPFYAPIPRAEYAIEQ